MSTYQYQSVFCRNDAEFDETSNRMGAKGWRVISTERRPPTRAAIGDDWIAVLFERETKPPGGVGYGGDVK